MLSAAVSGHYEILNVLEKQTKKTVKYSEVTRRVFESWRPNERGQTFTLDPEDTDL